MGKRVLCVDDDEEVLELLKDTLEPMGCDVTTAADGGEGLEKWNAGPAFDLLVTDLLVPKLDGIRLAEAVRAKNPEARILVITAVAHSLEKELSAAPISGWLPKPISIGKLKARVRELLSESGN